MSNNTIAEYLHHLLDERIHYAVHSATYPHHFAEDRVLIGRYLNEALREFSIDIESERFINERRTRENND